MATAGGANYKHLGYFGQQCPNGNPKPHVVDVTYSGSQPYNGPGLSIGPETPTELCPFCMEAHDD